MAKVEIYNERYFEKALRHFKMRCIKEGIFRECRERRHFVKPSKKRRDKRQRKNKTQKKFI